MMNSFNDRQAEIVKTYYKLMGNALKSGQWNDFVKTKEKLEKILNDFKKEEKKEVDSKE